MVQYVPVTPTRSKCNTKRVTGERVLTSAKALAILKEKEEKKLKEAEEKEKRKQERENKKREKEKLTKKGQRKETRNRS